MADEEVKSPRRRCYHDVRNAIGHAVVVYYSDHPDKIDYRKMEKVTRTVYMTMWELADAAARPRVDKQLPGELAGERN